MITPSKAITGASLTSLTCGFHKDDATGMMEERTGVLWPTYW